MKFINLKIKNKLVQNTKLIYFVRIRQKSCLNNTNKDVFDPTEVTIIFLHKKTHFFLIFNLLIYNTIILQEIVHSIVRSGSCN